jgi:hypothetical protein
MTLGEPGFAYFSFLREILQRQKPAYAARAYAMQTASKALLRFTKIGFYVNLLLCVSDFFPF